MEEKYRKTSHHKVLLGSATCQIILFMCLFSLWLPKKKIFSGFFSRHKKPLTQLSFNAHPIYVTKYFPQTIIKFKKCKQCGYK